MNKNLVHLETSQIFVNLDGMIGVTLEIEIMSLIHK